MKLAIPLLLLLCSCAQLTPEQQAELNTLRAQVLSAEAGIRSHAAELDQARKDFAAGKLTAEQLSALVVRGQEQVAVLVQTAQAASAKVADLAKHGIPPWQSFWEAGGRELLIAAGGAWILRNQKQGDEKAVAIALTKVIEQRGPIDARKGAAPKLAADTGRS